MFLKTKFWLLMLLFCNVLLLPCVHSAPSSEFVNHLRLAIDEVSPSYITPNNHLPQDELSVALWINEQLRSGATLDLGVFKVSSMDFLNGLRVKYKNGTEVIFKIKSLSVTQVPGYFVLDLLKRHETIFNPESLDAQIEEFRDKVSTRVLTLYPHPKSVYRILIQSYLDRLPETNKVRPWYSRAYRFMRRSMPHKVILGHEYLAFLQVKWDLLDLPMERSPLFTTELRDEFMHQGITDFIEPKNFLAKLVLSLFSREIESRGFLEPLKRIANKQGRLSFTVDPLSDFPKDSPPANRRIYRDFKDFSANLAGKSISFQYTTKRIDEVSTSSWEILLTQEWCAEFFEEFARIIHELDPSSCNTELDKNKANL